MKILVVEDEPDLNHIIAKHLQAEGYIVDSCFNGNDAVYYISFEEVLARLRVIIKRSPQEHGTTYECADLLIDTDKKSVTRAGTDIELSPKEYAILEYMVRNKNIALSRLQIESNAWGLDFEGESNIIDVYIRYLRKKIDDDFDVKLIQTVRGIGYMLTEPD